MQSNRDTARRVWQRVNSPQKESAATMGEREALRKLLALCFGDQMTFRAAAARASASEQLLLRQLEKNCADEAACLRGIHLLVTGGALKTPTQTGGGNLRQCYQNTLARLSGYSLRTGDPLCGPAYRQLEQQSRQQALLLLQLMGKEQQKSGAL